MKWNLSNIEKQDTIFDDTRPIKKNTKKIKKTLYSIKSNIENNYIGVNSLVGQKESFVDKDKQTPLQIIEELGIEEITNSFDINNYIDVTPYINYGKSTIIETDFIYINNKINTPSKLAEKNYLFYDNLDQSNFEFSKIYPFSDDLSDNYNKITSSRLISSGHINKKNVYYSSGFTYKTGNYTQNIDSIVFGGKTK